MDRLKEQVHVILYLIHQALETTEYGQMNREETLFSPQNYLSWRVKCEIYALVHVASNFSVV